MGIWLEKLRETLLSALFPRRCPFCGRTAPRGAPACAACDGALPYVTGPLCPRCGRGISNCRCGDRQFAFARCVAPFYYEGAVRKAIIRFKFYGRSYSSAAFAQFCARTVAREYASVRFDCVTCVPLAAGEYRKRGFNQSELFARALARALGLPFLNLLVKPRAIAPQRTLGARERLRNVAGAFRAAKEVPGKTILLADDIVTTGATLSDCARALRGAGAEKVFCAAIACVRPGTEQ